MGTERHDTPAEDLARELIEEAFRDHLHCRQCGEEMMMVARGRDLRIECASLDGKSGLRYLLASGLHESAVVALPRELIAA